MDKICAWYNQEELTESTKPTLYVWLCGIKGSLSLAPSGWELTLFLSELEADNLAFAINSNLQNMALARKDLKNE